MTMRRAGPDHIPVVTHRTHERSGAPHFPLTETRLPAAGPVHRRSPSSRYPRRATLTTSCNRNLSARRGTNFLAISSGAPSPAGRQYVERKP